MTGRFVMPKLLYLTYYIITSNGLQIKRLAYSLSHVIPAFMSIVWDFILQFITNVTKMFIHGVRYFLFVDDSLSTYYLFIDGAERYAPFRVDDGV